MHPDDARHLAFLDAAAFCVHVPGGAQILLEARATLSSDGRLQLESVDDDGRIERYFVGDDGVLRVTSVEHGRLRVEALVHGRVKRTATLRDLPAPTDPGFN